MFSKRKKRKLEPVLVSGNVTAENKHKISYKFVILYNRSRLDFWLYYLSKQQNYQFVQRSR